MGNTLSSDKIPRQQGAMKVILAEITKLNERIELMRAQLLQAVNPRVNDNAALNLEIKNSILQTPFMAVNQSGLHCVTKQTAKLLQNYPDERIRALANKNLAVYDTHPALINELTGMVGIDFQYPNKPVQYFAYYNVKYGTCSPGWKEILRTELQSQAAWDQSVENCIYRHYNQLPFITSNPEKWEIISPLCVAMMLGDLELFKTLEQRFDLRGYDKVFHFFKFAVVFAQDQMLEYLFSKRSIYPNGMKESIVLFQIALENNSLAVIEVLSNHCEIPNESIELARSKNPFLANYLELKKIARICNYSQNYSPLLFLADNSSNHDFLMRMLCVFPQLINYQDPTTGNTFLHELILCKKAEPIKCYLSAIESAKLIKDIPFDIELKTTDDKSALKLAFESGDKDMVVALLIYADPAIKDFETEINQMNIIMSDVMRERNSLMRKTTQKVAQMQSSHMQVLQQTNMNVGELAMAQEGTHQLLNQVVAVVASAPAKANQRISLFKPVKAITNHDDNPNDLESVRAEVSQLKRDMVVIQERLLVLENRLGQPAPSTAHEVRGLNILNN